MPEVAEHPKFSVHPFTGDEVLEDIRHLLERHPFAVTRVCHSPENTKNTLVITVIQLTTLKKCYRYGCNGTLV